MNSSVIQADIGEVTNVKTVCFKWCIRNFSDLYKSDAKEKVVSPVFAQSWSLAMYPLGKNNKDEEYISLYLNNEQDVDVTARAVMSLIDKAGSKVKSYVLTKDVFKVRGEKGSRWGAAKFCQRSLITDPSRSVIADGTVTIQCEISIDERADTSRQVRVDEKPPTIDCPTRLEELSFMEKMFENEQFTDVTFSMEDQKIRAHKSVLILRSSVFEEMLLNDPRGSTHNVIVEIKSIKPHVFKEFIRFLYTARVNNIEEIAKELLVAAEKYAVSGLKVMCEKALCEKLTLDNVLEFITLADFVSADNLKKQAIDFIKSHSETIVASPSFKQFGRKNVDLLLELTEEIITSQAKKPRLQ